MGKPWILPGREHARVLVTLSILELKAVLYTRFFFIFSHTVLIKVFLTNVYEVNHMRTAEMKSNKE